MALDVRELEAFYDRPLGQVARRLVLRRLRILWPDLKGQRLLGFGFVAPYLKAFAPETERVFAAMPAQQGACAWGADARIASVLVEENSLPFPTSAFDRILLVHSLEMTEAERPFMRELWRALTPEGRMIIVAPNRTSLWAQFETTPFGHGRPYSRGQLERLLQRSLFVPERWDMALFLPPMRRRAKGGTGWERAGRVLCRGLAGVHIVEASKSMYSMAPAPAKAVRRPALAGAAR
ncbi:MAG: class I SAM-dependent methyltransferase [Alphaproteobacteria bacterium]